ncbi:MAG: RNA polymerase sigma-70 factor (ECF subfamily) [Polyangiales bacterium]|jgi:RNA polymerase sigma-70 factor (ECF subfamily)
MESAAAERSEEDEPEGLGGGTGDNSTSDAPEAKSEVNEATPVPSKAVKTKTTAADRERDRELVRAVQRGDTNSFRQLFDRYHRRAYAVAFGVVKNQQDALDIVQEGFIKVHRHIANFQGTSSFYTWLYRIIMNLSIDHVRRNKKGRNLDYDDRVRRDEEDVAGDGAILPSILNSNPSKSVLRKELSTAIQAALGELPEHHRAVIVLREVEGLSYEEMARILEVPKGTIMSRLFHARRKMQEALAPYLQGDLDIRESK